MIPFSSPGLPSSYPLESLLFRPPPRITLKLKMPKSSSLGNGNSSAKFGNGPLCPDNSVNVSEHSGEGLGQGKPQLHGAAARREERSNGRLSSSSSSALPLKPSGKPLALHAALHGHSSKSNSKQEAERASAAKSNGRLEMFLAQKDGSCQTHADPDASKKTLGKNSFRKSAMEHFGRSFKDATINLVRTAEDLRASDKLSTKERLWAKPASAQNKVKSKRSFQDSDGYCPDLELSDSESEPRGRHRQKAALLPKLDAPRKGMGRGKQLLGSRHPVQR